MATSTVDEIKALISAQWKMSTTKKINWEGLESVARSILREEDCKSITAEEALKLIDEAIAAWTLRGRELKN